MLWDVDTLDWKLKKNAQWVDNAMEQIKLREDCLVLMHDIHPDDRGHELRFIERIQRIKGHRFTLY